MGIFVDGLYAITSTIYNFLNILYHFVVQLASTSFIRGTVLEGFVQTVYVLAGVFMLFRITVSFLNMMVDPDRISDKSEGPTKILTRVVIVVLLMIALVPDSYVYRLLDRVQEAVIGENGLIVNLVSKTDIALGVDNTSPSTSTNNNTEEQFAKTLLSTMTICSDDSADECNSLKDTLLTDGKEARNNIKNEKMDVIWLIAILVGIAVIAYLVFLCVEVIIRSLKIIFLQMVAPIAIISYVSPKDKVLGAWARMYSSTYLDLFIKLLAIKLGATLVTSITFSGDIITDLLLIIGVLVFMKIIPTMISKIFGIDVASGTFKDSVKMLSRAVTAAPMVAGSMIARGVSKGAELNWGRGNRLKSGLKTAGAAMMGGMSGARAVAKGDKFSMNMFKEQAAMPKKETEKNAMMDKAYQNYLEQENSKAYQEYRNNELQQAQSEGRETNFMSYSDFLKSQPPKTISRARYARRAKLASLAGDYLGIRTEKKNVQDKIDKLNEDSGRIKEMHRSVGEVTSAISSAISSGTEKVETHDSKGIIAQEYNRNVEVSTSLKNMSEEQWQRLDLNTKRAYVSNQEIEQIKSDFSTEQIKSDFERALKNKDGTYKTDVELKEFVDSGLVTVKTVDGQRNIFINTDDTDKLIASNILRNQTLIDRRLAINSMIDQNKRDGEIEYVVLELGKKTEDRNKKINSLVQSINTSLNNAKNQAEHNFRMATTSDDRDYYDSKLKDINEKIEEFAKFTSETDYSNKTVSEMIDVINEFKKSFKGAFDNMKGELDRKISEQTTDLANLKEEKEMLETMENATQNKK